MKLDAKLVSALKLILEELVAARRQYRKPFLGRKVRQTRRMRGENWFAALTG